MLKFEWDENKNKLNQAKHSIHFEKTKEVFEDENAKQSGDESDHGASHRNG